MPQWSSGMIPALGLSEIAGGPRFDLGLRPFVLHIWSTSLGLHCLHGQYTREFRFVQQKTRVAAFGIHVDS